MNLEQVIEIQATNHLGEYHIVWIDENGWACAHTDAERKLRDLGAASLEDCSINNWIDYHVDQPAPTGLYMAENEDGWVLIPLTKWTYVDVNGKHEIHYTLIGQSPHHAPHDHILNVEVEYSNKDHDASPLD